MKTKNYLFIVIGFLICTYIQAQIPEKIDFQAVARDGNNPIVEEEIGVKISLLQGTPPSLTVVFEEEHSTTTDAYGLFNLEIGTGDPGMFATIDWSLGNYFVKVEIDITGGTNYIEMGTMELLSVPYALYSKRSASSYWDKDNTSIFYDEGNVGIGTTEPDAKLDINGDMKIGNNGTIFSEVLELSGITLSGGETPVPYPAGYTMDNTRVLSITIYYNGTLGVYWDDNVPVRLFEEEILLNYPLSSGYSDTDYRLLIMKIE